MLCAECHIEIDATKQVSKRIAGVPHCEVCFEVYCAVKDRVFFVVLHLEWQKDNEQRKRLRPGADYFS